MIRVGVVVVVVALAAFPAHAIVGGANDSGDTAVVLLVAGGVPYCSGSIIGTRTVLTAGHCALDVGVEIDVVVGADISAPQKTFEVVEWAQHPKYTGEGFDYDVALLRLDRDAHVAPLPLANHKLVAGDVGTNLRHVGFGNADEESGTGRGTKRTVDFPITKLSPTMVYSVGVDKQTCDGDSGGPAFFVDDDGAERIIAVVSDGPNCHDEGWDARVDTGARESADVRRFIDDTFARFEDPRDAPPPSCGCRSRGSPSTTAALLVFAFALRLTRVRSRRATLERCARLTSRSPSR